MNDMIMNHTIIDWARLVPHVLRHRSMESSIHGPKHWARVCRNALFCARGTAADTEIIRLFALLHDWKRENDLWDPQHGERAAASVEELQGSFFQLSVERLRRLKDACTGHAHGQIHADPTIAACWDGDRLDLLRVGQEPCDVFMSTFVGRSICVERNWGVLDDAPMVPVVSWGL